LPARRQENIVQFCKKLQFALFQKYSEILIFTSGDDVSGVEPLDSHMRPLGQKVDLETVDLHLLVSGGVSYHGEGSAHHQTHVL